MNTTGNGKVAPRWKKFRSVGLGFLIAGIVISGAHRLTETPFLAGWGPKLAVTGIVVIGVSFVHWWHTVHSERDE